nr:MAG TPA: hypothetical protein [Caudoviricetes sp.]
MHIILNTHSTISNSVNKVSFVFCQVIISFLMLSLIC